LICDLEPIHLGGRKYNFLRISIIQCKKYLEKIKICCKIFPYMREKRKFLRFPVSLSIKVEEEKGYQGEVRDFSRGGVKCFFKEFDYPPQTVVNFKIQRPDRDIFVPFKGEVVWKRKLSSGWEVGINIKEFSPLFKSEILEFGYTRWLNNKYGSK